MNTRKCARVGLACLLAFFAPSAMAGEFNAVVNGRSIHIGAAENWNENNLGLGVEYQFATETRWKKILLANGFRDSNDSMSYMAGAGLYYTLFDTPRLGDFYVDIGASAFLMTREDVNDNRPFPGILPSLTIGNRYAGINLTYLPVQAVERMTDTHMSDDSVKGIVFLQVKFSLGNTFRTD